MANDNKKLSSLSEFNLKFGDPWIWGIYLALILISIIENYSASSQEVATKGVYGAILPHIGFLLCGTAMTAFIAKHDYNDKKFLGISIPLLAIVTVAALVYVMFFGKVVNGAQRAIHLPGITVQPTEFAKLSIATLLAYLLAKNQKDKGLTNRGMYMALGAVAVYCGLMIRSGFTNCAIIILLCGFMLIIGGVNIKKLFVVGCAGCLVGAGAFLISSKGNDNDEVLRQAEKDNQTTLVDEKQPSAQTDVTEHGGGQVLSTQPAATEAPKVDRWAMRKKRILDWWNNDSLVYWTINDDNRQEALSRIAQAHGGIFGVGPGQSRECSRLPLAFSDYIYSIIIEEIGLVGGTCVMLIYLCLLGRATIIVRKCNRALPSLLIIGMALLITLQALVHMAINTGVFPVSGQPLPLISKGGSAIISICAAFGIMLSVSRTITLNKIAQSNATTTEPELPEGLDAENPIQITPKNVWK